MKSMTIGLWVGLLIIGLALAAPMALADTTWTNVSASEVRTGVWGDNANWDNGKPGAEIAYLTNTVNSYVVNYNTTDTDFTNGTLRMSHASPHTVTLNINAALGEFGHGYYCHLTALYSLAIVNVNDGGTWNVRYNYGTTSGNLIVHDGGTVNMSYGNSNNDKMMKILIASGGLFNGEYAISPGGRMTVEQGGAYTGREMYIGDRQIVGTAVVTNRGSFVTTRDLYVGSAMRYSNRYAIFRMEGGGVARIGTEGANYGLGISRCPDGTWYGNSAGGDANCVLSGGVVTNNVLQVGYSLATDAGTRSANGFLTLEDGSFWNLKHALIGGFPTTIIGDSVDNVENNLRGTVNQSGGSFRSLGHVYVANGPSTGTLNLSGGTFTVNNSGGTATLYLGANEGANVNLVGKGKINLSGGYLAVDRLVATNGAVNSVIDFSSGTMEIGEAADVGAGTDVTVGNGVSPARLILRDGSTSVFAVDLTINTNALLDIGGTNVIGAASVTGDVTLESGAALRVEFADADTADVLTVAGSVVLDGELDVATLAGYDPSGGTQWTVLTASAGITGSFSSISQGYKAWVSGGDTLMVMKPPVGTVITIH